MAGSEGTVRPRTAPEHSPFAVGRLQEGTSNLSTEHPFQDAYLVADHVSANQIPVSGLLEMTFAVGQHGADFLFGSHADHRTTSR